MPPRVSFTTVLEKATDMDAVGIVVPAEAVAALGPGKRPPVTVTLKGYSYRSTVAVMGGRFLLPLAKVHRDAARVEGGQTVTVTLELDTAPRDTPVPADLEAALQAAGALDAFRALAPTHRKEWVRSVDEAKKPETRLRRIEKAVAAVTAARH